jgi:hypothetical protein
MHRFKHFISSSVGETCIGGHLARDDTVKYRAFCRHVFTCHPGGGFVRGGLRVRLRPGSGVGWCLGLGRTQLCPGEALHHVPVLAVAFPAAALLLPAVLGRHKVVAAVVAEDAAAQPAERVHR